MAVVPLMNQLHGTSSCFAYECDQMSKTSYTSAGDNAPKAR